MSVYFEKIPLPQQELFLLRNFTVPFMSYPMHYHPEVEITLIEQSFGQRFVGDHIEDFHEGDLIMIGPNLPHQWRNDSYFHQLKGKAKLTVIHFREESLMKFRDIMDFSHIVNLLLEARRGIKFSGIRTEEFKATLQKLQNAPQSDRLIGFLNLINIMAKAASRQMLSSSDIQKLDTGKYSDRINQVYTNILDNYHRDITLAAAAEQVHLSPSAFSHFIKNRTGHTFSQLVNDLRIKYAIKLLIDTDMNITEICYKSGFRNLSYFNRQFKSSKRCSPLEYRKQYHKEYLQSYEGHKNLKN